MRKVSLLSVFILFVALFSKSFAQGTNYVGNWESTTPVVQYNNLTVRISISSTTDPNVFVLINIDKPKRKFIGKYNDSEDRLYTTIAKKPIYFKYNAVSDILECYRQKDDSKVYELTRY